MLALLCTLVWALTPQQADDRIRSMDDLEVVPELYRRIDAPFVVQHGQLSVALTSGVMVPVFSGHFSGAWETQAAERLRRLRAQDKDAQLPAPEDRGDRSLVGFVWLHGEAEVEVTLPRRADAIELASRQVLYTGADVDTMREVARQRKPFETTASEGLFLTVDPKLDARFLGDDPAADPHAELSREARE